MESTVPAGAGDPRRVRGDGEEPAAQVRRVAARLEMAQPS
jgi:hypothetical protein